MDLKHHEEEIIESPLSYIKNMNNLFSGSPDMLCETICNLYYNSNGIKLTKIKAMVFVIKDYKTFLKKKKFK